MAGSPTAAPWSRSTGDAPTSADASRAPRKGGRKRFETEWREPKVLTLYVLGEDGRRDRSVLSVIDGDESTRGPEDDCS